MSMVLNFGVMPVGAPNPKSPQRGALSSLTGKYCLEQYNKYLPYCTSLTHYNQVFFEKTFNKDDYKNSSCTTNGLKGGDG